MSRPTLRLGLSALTLQLTDILRASRFLPGALQLPGPYQGQLET